MAQVQDFVLNTATPTLIASGVGEVYINNVSGSVDIFLGDSAVTSSTGLQVRLLAAHHVGQHFHLHLSSTDEVYAVTNSGTPTIRVLQTR